VEKFSNPVNTVPYFSQIFVLRFQKRI